MKTKFLLRDKHINFAHAIAGGSSQAQAFRQFISPRSNSKTCEVNGSKLCKRPEMKKMIEKARKERDEEIKRQNIAIMPKELSTAALTIDQLDALHYSVVLGVVEVEEIHPVVTITKNELGREVQRTVNFHRVKRKPNIREKQASIDALYKRFGSYAPTRLFGAFKNVSEDVDEPNVERVVLLSDGKKIKIG